jgi:Secretion system C-terminal sorting domain
MKKVLIIIICLISLVGFSQMTLKKLDGTVINDGDVLTYTQATDPESYLGLKIFNSSSSDIRVKIKVISLVNVTGSDFQLCIDPICVSSLTVGNSYPDSGSIIPANGTNGNYDHFVNTNPGNGSVIEYGFKLYQINDNDQEVGNAITFTYRYNGSLSNQSFSNQLSTLGVSLKSNIVANSLEIEASKNTQLSMYDINGKLMREQILNSGSHSIDTSILNSGTYILSFRNNEGQTATSKIIKK